MEWLMHIDYGIVSSLLVVAVLCALLPYVRRMNALLKKHEEQRVSERLKQLEQELEVYMVRSQRRLEMFKKVIDGIDQVVQNVKGVIDEEHAEELQLMSAEGKRALSHEGYRAAKEAEVISIKQYEEKE